jgi:myosin heavy subunit
MLPVRRDVDAEKFIQVLRSENAALRKKNQALAEKNRLLHEKLVSRPGKLSLSSSVGPTKAGKAGTGKRLTSGSHKSTGAEAAAFQGSDIESQVQSARKLHRDTFPGKLEAALKSRLVLAEKQLVKLQKENEQLRAGVNIRRNVRNNNDSEGSSDDNDDNDESGKPRLVKLSSVEVEHMKRELRERQAQLAILNARYENLESNALAEREIQEKTLEQMEQMNRQVHKLRTQLQDVQIEKEELEVKANKHAELDKEVESLREQNHRLESRMTALCESPFINDAFQRKERIDRLFDLEKLTQQQKETITRLTDENHKLQQLVKEIQGNVKQMKQTKDGVEAELQRIKQLLVEERNAKISMPIQMQITPRQPAAIAPSKPPEPVVVTIPVRQPERRDASSSPLHAAQAPKAEPSPATYG